MLLKLVSEFPSDLISLSNLILVDSSASIRNCQRKEVKMSLIPSLFCGRQSNAFDPFSLEIWDLFKDFPLSSSSLSGSQFARENSAFVNSRVDWKETPEAHVFKADLPGLKKEEVKVEVEDDRVLQISGERNVEKENKNDTWHRVERSSGKFLRRFRLPENAKMDEIKAAMENGVLTVTVPKAELKKPDVKAIEISS
ncbi:hypothetical protein F2P56_032421 [Juglans regia]|uniref:18.1 kDa class I heat shock protein-like n=2 Tax=Juglans regia TaxID=51240 RepID=A0A2I4FG07_JUGRE|nr:18.1 kDa class I heat shock protein-like [Juglans regia]KAF5446822.1 hypothetical protein F2P56_032421 [Juglans regia]